VSLQEASRLELFATKHAGVNCQRLTIWTDDDGWREAGQGGEENEYISNISAPGLVNKF